MSKLIDLIGRRFGSLVVLRLCDNRMYGKALWHCKCDCGNEIDVLSNNLLRGLSTRCMKCKFEDLTGKRYGLLTVIGFDHSNGVDRFWKCKCDCGGECITSSDNLRRGGTSSCGCKLHYNLVGKTYGDLTVISEIPGHDKFNNKVWNCQCACGKSTTVTSHHLVSGEVKSCGCLRHNGDHLRKYFGVDKKLNIVYKHMVARCYNPHDKNFDRYGGRGIYIDEEWLRDRRVFFEWCKKNGYAPELTIERKDLNGPYAPWNCTFIAAEKQAINRCGTRFYTVLGVTHSIADWARLVGANPKSINRFNDVRFCRYLKLTLISLSRDYSTIYGDQVRSVFGDADISKAFVYKSNINGTPILK